MFGKMIDLTWKRHGDGLVVFAATQDGLEWLTLVAEQSDLVMTEDGSLVLPEGDVDGLVDFAGTVGLDVAPAHRTLAELAHVRMGAMTKAEQHMVFQASCRKLEAELKARHDEFVALFARPVL